MAFISDTSSAAASDFTAVRKPVVVRVKRKSWQSRLDALWLEINERPLKRRPVLDFDKLSIDDDYSRRGQVGELNSKKVFVRYVETVGTSENITDVVQSFMYDSADAVVNKPGIKEQKRNFKKDRKQEELLSKGRRDQEVLAQNARFEQIWRSRREKKEALHDMCHFYDVVRVHDEEGSNEMQEQEYYCRTICLEDQKILNRYLPIPREFIPSAVAEIESDIYAYLSEQGYEVMPRSFAAIESDIHVHMYEQDDYVYDYYTVKNDLYIGEQDAISSFPVVQVEDDVHFYDGPDYESEYDSDDSNAEAHPQNDYPDETSEEDAASTDEEKDEEEKGDGASSRSEEEEEEEEEEDSDHVSSISPEFEDLRRVLAQDGVPSCDDGSYDNDDDNFDYMEINEDLRNMDINETSQ
ncbi:RNA-directed DNA methylation 4 isoform X1 [Ricinus communis]|uniref:RNA-directed DNA methylation 4 isoform X1 n=1 Tax=Ricinus communis TaxID=3988 RepID=UPI00201ADECB|nr:RNA-directed DNA methylation 4 isoform X1 [Ricinus communis]